MTFYPDELHESEQRNERMQLQLTATQARNKALAVVEERNQTLDAKLSRLQATWFRLDIENSLIYTNLL